MEQYLFIQTKSAKSSVGDALGVRIWGMHAARYHQKSKQCIGGSRGSARDATPLWVQVLSFSCSFR